MKVREAIPGQILLVKGRIPKPYLKNLSDEERQVCSDAGLVPGFLMPAWIGNENPPHAWPTIEDRDSERISSLFYLGPIRLRQLVGGLKKYHVFLYDGDRIGLMGYDFRHLEPISESV